MIRCGSASPLVQRGLALHEAAARRSVAQRWMLVDAVLLSIILYDLWCGSGCAWGAERALEALVAAALLAALVTHAARCRLPAAPGARAAPAPRITRDQQRLLALTDAQLETSFELVESAEELCPNQSSVFDRSSAELDALDISVASRESWGGGGARASPPSPRGGDASPPPSPRTPDHFISDRDTLHSYLKEWSTSVETGAGVEVGGRGAGPAPLYRPAPPPAAPAPAPPPAGEVLHNTCLNMRAWIQATIISRIAEQIELQRASSPPTVKGSASAAVGSGAAAGSAASTLQQYLHVAGYGAAHAAYVSTRLLQLNSSPCLGEYRWDGGGALWEADRPTDAEVVMHAFTTYVGAAMAGAWAAPRIVRVSRRPPHYAVSREGAAGGGALQLARGRNNVFQCCAAWLAACRRHPARALLNLHWVLDERRADTL